MNIQTQYETEIMPEIASFANYVEDVIYKNSNIKEYFKGWRVFFSPVLFRPKVLLIGINPGAGQSGVRDLDFWDNNYIFEYINPAYSFALSRETNDVFNQAGLGGVLATTLPYYFFQRPFQPWKQWL